MLSLRDDQIEKMVKRMPDENGMTEADILRVLISRGLRTSEAYRRDAIVNAKIDAMMRSFAVDMTVIDNTVGEYLEEVETAESLNPLYPDTDIEKLSGTQVDGVFPIYPREPPSRFQRTLNRRDYRTVPTKDSDPVRGHTLDWMSISVLRVLVLLVGCDRLSSGGPLRTSEPGHTSDSSSPSVSARCFCK